VRRGALARFFFAAELRATAAWSAAVAAYNVLNIWLFTVYGKETSIAQVYEKLPRMWKSAFGRYFISVNSLEGWLAAQFFSFFPVVAGSWLAILCASLFAADEETRAVVCLLTQPVRRSALWAAKAGAAGALLLALLGVNLGVSLASVAAFTPDAAPLGLIVLTYAMCALFLLFLAALFMAVAACLGTQRSAVGAGLGLLFLLFLLNMVAATLELPAWVRGLNPFHYYDASRLVRDRTIPPAALAYWIAGSALLGAVSLFAFVRRERR
jgi:ABC-type transport system involved in multi-copper enzyme maturation permease subunit